MAIDALRQDVEAAALVRINERCALAYQHDVRGTLQAVYSTVELLKRSLGANMPDPARIEKISGLASGALQRHEEAILTMLDTLTSRRMSPVAVDVGASMTAVGRFLRNEAASREISIAVHGPAGVTVHAAPNSFRTLLTGLLLVAIDSASNAARIVVTVGRRDAAAIVEFSGAGRVDAAAPDVILTYASRYLEGQGGGLELTATPAGTRLLMAYPAGVSPAS